MQPDPIDLQQLQAESIGWLPMGEGAYLHVSEHPEEDQVIEVVGIPDAAYAGVSVLLLG